VKEPGSSLRLPGEANFAPTVGTQGESPPEQGFARVQAQQRRETRTEKPAAGSADASPSRPAGKEEATWGNQGSPHGKEPKASDAHARGFVRA
jgi:hypothetical protein